MSSNNNIQEIDNATAQELLGMATGLIRVAAVLANERISAASTNKRRHSNGDDHEVNVFFVSENFAVPKNLIIFDI